ncbi:MAG: hypothetical protein LBF70_00335 [Holosporales bacterium]|nr:hypothetical protein [Holosporales bacterium]
MNSEEFISLLKTYNADLFVSMSFNQIFKSEIINLPMLKSINCHAGKLPFYRGRNVLNWALINDEEEFGITVHYIDEGIDTGDIILQRIFSITDLDNYKTLLEVAYTECANILYDAIILIKQNQINVIVQNQVHPVGMYCGRRHDGDERINWNSTSRELFNFIRALCDPGIMARSFINDKLICINESKMVENAVKYKGIVGQILNKDIEGNFYVKTQDTILKITDYIYEGIVRVGDRLI